MKVDKRSTTSNKSIIKKLTHEGVVSDPLLVLINNLTLEDLIAIKLELAWLNELCTLIEEQVEVKAGVLKCPEFLEGWNQEAEV